MLHFFYWRKPQFYSNSNIDRICVLYMVIPPYFVSNSIISHSTFICKSSSYQRLFPYIFHGNSDFLLSRVALERVFLYFHVEFFSALIKWLNILVGFYFAMRGRNVESIIESFVEFERQLCVHLKKRRSRFTTSTTSVKDSFWK